jgi:hypothetical protein
MQIAQNQFYKKLWEQQASTEAYAFLSEEAYSIWVQVTAMTPLAAV